MKKAAAVLLLIAIFAQLLQSCKKEVTQIVDFSKYTATDNECRIVGVADTTQWINSVLSRAQDTALLIFADNIFISDTQAAKISITAPCPNPSNGFFIWNVNPSRQCKLKLVCVNTDGDILYYNSYGLLGGPMTLGFDFRNQTVFRSGTNYRMYYGFFNSLDSLYFSGHGDIRIQ